MSLLADPGYLSVAMWTLGLGAIGAAVTGIILANTDLFLSKTEKASLDFLEAIDLKTLGQGEQRTFKAKELWKMNGAVIMAKQFYGPLKRKMLFLALFRCKVWRNFWRAWRSGYSGNMDGEGIVLGGVFVIGPRKQGVLLEHREKEFGDKVSLDAVLDAVKKIKAQPSDRGE